MNAANVDRSKISHGKLRRQKKKKQWMKKAKLSSRLFNGTYPLSAPKSCQNFKYDCRDLTHS